MRTLISVELIARSFYIGRENFSPSKAKLTSSTMMDTQDLSGHGDYKHAASDTPNTGSSFYDSEARDLRPLQPSIASSHQDFQVSGYQEPNINTISFNEIQQMSQGHQLVNKVTPPTAALDSPSSPPPAGVSDGNAAVDTTSDPFGMNRDGADKASSKRGVPHIYRDFANLPDASGYVRKKTGGVTQPFPEKLHEMLDHVNEPSIVGWLPHGRAFLVRKPKQFTAQVMPQYFRQTKLTSFQRQYVSCCHLCLSLQTLTFIHVRAQA